MRMAPMDRILELIPEDAKRVGLVGAAVALGAQDLFKNLIAGIFIIGEQRFQTGDWISVDGIVEGTIEFIGLRTTKVRRFDMAPVFVPNSKLADNASSGSAPKAAPRPDKSPPKTFA